MFPALLVTRRPPTSREPVAPSGPGVRVLLASHRDLRNNVISTVQPGAFLGLGELKRL